MTRVFDYAQSAVQADPSVIFCLDSDLRITYCNPAWDRFALENGGEALCSPAPIGRSVLDFISGPDRDYFATHYRRVLRGTEPWEHDYECSSPDTFRKFRLRALPMRTRAGLMVINSLCVEHPLDLVGHPPLEAVYRMDNGMIVMCSGCRRTRRVEPASVWDWVPGLVERMPLDISHGICERCKELYYPDHKG